VEVGRRDTDNPHEDIDAERDKHRGSTRAKARAAQAGLCSGNNDYTSSQVPVQRTKRSALQKVYYIIGEDDDVRKNLIP
jgi:hypothetical protein